MRKALSAAVAVASVLVLTACGSSDPNYVPPSPQPTIQSNNIDLWTSIVKIPVDGKLITCIKVDGYQELSISCDWDHPGAIPDGQPTSQPDPPSAD